MERRVRSSVGRVSVPVPAPAQKALERPELLGLSSNASAAAVFSRLVEIGWDRTLREQREKAGWSRASVLRRRDDARRG